MCVIINKVNKFIKYNIYMIAITHGCFYINYFYKQYL